MKNEPQLHKADLLAARLNNEDGWDVGTMYDHCVMVTHKVWMFRRGVNVLFAKLWIRLSNSDLQKQTKT